MYLWQILQKVKRPLFCCKFAQKLQTFETSKVFSQVQDPGPGPVFRRCQSEMSFYIRRSNSASSLRVQTPHKISLPLRISLVNTSNFLCICMFTKETLKGPLSGLRQFLVTESPLKVTKNAFYFIFKILFFFEIFVLTFWLCRKTV